MTRILARAAGLAAALALAGLIAFQVSPWPRALLIRRAFTAEAARVSAALARHVPAGLAERHDEHYDASDPDAFLDMYSASGSEDEALPTVVWVHGGAWVSGSRKDVANYARILAGRGFTVVAVGYSIAPGARYPTPIRQLATALNYVQQHAGRLRVDRSSLFLAGDSAGAQIAAQMAAIVSVPSYAAAMRITPPLDRGQLHGVILYCGVYDLDRLDPEGPFGAFLETVLWSYTGTKTFADSPAGATLSVIDHVTSAFPPAFISSGNADPLTPQSRAFADALARLGVDVDSLFFEAGHEPPLPHEYQFNLDGADGRQALARTVTFLAGRSR